MGALDGRVAIITGAGRGLGREHALLFAAEGAKVVINDRGGANDGAGADASPAEQVAQEIRDLGGEAVSNGDDIADWEGAQALVNTAIDAFGDLDILVNNAGILRDRVLVNMTEAEWDDVVRVHMKGHFAPSRWAAAYWREQAKAGNEKPRNIVHTSSTSGLMSNPGQSNYGAAKSGIATFSQILAKELVRYGVQEQLHRPRRPHPADAGDAGPRRDHGAQGGVVRRVGPEERVAARVLPRLGGLRLQRRDVLRAGRHRQARQDVGRWPRRSSRRTSGRSPRSARPSPPSSRTDDRPGQPAALPLAEIRVLPTRPVTSVGVRPDAARDPRAGGSPLKDGRTWTSPPPATATVAANGRLWTVAGVTPRGDRVHVVAAGADGDARRRHRPRGAGAHDAARRATRRGHRAARAGADRGRRRDGDRGLSELSRRR